MRVPIEWLKDFVQVDLSPDDLAERLTMAGLEVESVEDTPYGAVLAMYITPNRGDCLSIFGIAREVYALLGEAARPTELFHRLNAQILNPPSAKPLDAAQYARVEIRDPDLCPRYAARVIRDIKPIPAPAYVQNRLLAAGMRPIMELSFMPTGLATNGDKSPPKDYNEWKNFIAAVAKRCIEKYGQDDVSKWYWEVWNEPDYVGFWNNTDMDAYYTLYDNTVAALVSVIPNVLVGGPATTGAYAVSAFLKHTKSAGTRVNFVSCHNYPGGDAKGKVADANNLVEDSDTRINAIISNGYSTDDVKSFNTEWNSSYNGQGGHVGDVITSMDNHWNVGFILKAVKLLADKTSGDKPVAEVFSYWALTDVFDEGSGTDGIHMTSKSNGNLPFDGVFGLMTFQGMRKASWNAFKMLNYTGSKRLQSSGGTGTQDGIDAMATASDNGDAIQIIVYNYYKTLNTASGSGDSVTVQVNNLPAPLANKEIFVTQFVVDENHSNPYSVWVKQGKVANPSEANWREMRAAQHLALMTKVGNKQTTGTSFSTTFNLAKQAGTLIILSTKRPLSGRNALVEIEGEDYDGQSGATKKDSGDVSMGQSISVTSGGSVYFENVDYTDDGVDSVDLRVKAASATSLELRADSQTGTLLGKCTVDATSSWATQSCQLSQKVNGVGRLYLVFGGAMELNWLKFKGTGTVTPTGGVGGTSGGAGGTSGGGAGGASGGSSGGANGGDAGGRTGGATSASGGARGGAGGGSTGASAPGGAGGGSSSSTGASAPGGAGGGSMGASAAGGGSGGSSSLGNAGSTDSRVGGNSSSGNGGAAGGRSETGGTSGTAGSRDSTTSAGATASGCSCRFGNVDRSSGTLLLMGLIATIGGLRRRGSRSRRLAE